MTFRELTLYELAKAYGVPELPKLHGEPRIVERATRIRINLYHTATECHPITLRQCTEFMKNETNANWYVDRVKKGWYAGDYFKDMEEWCMENEVCQCLALPDMPLFD